MRLILLLLTISCAHYASGQFGDNPQDFGYVTVRDGAHMFYWLFYTTADVANYTERPLIVWLQGGPGGSSTAIGNFEIMGPLDLSLQPRNYTWVKDFNVIYVDNPVGTGFSYVDNPSLLTTTNDEIALDFVNLMRGFYSKHPEFEGVPLYIFGQSYGGKMAVDMAIRMKEAEANGTISSNLRGIAMGNSWISPVDATLTWAPLLLAAGLVDQAGHDSIQEVAREAEALFNEGQYFLSTLAWSGTQQAVFQATHNVDFYDITTKMPSWQGDTRMTEQDIKEMLLRDMPYRAPRQDELSLDYIMNELVKPALNIPANVTHNSNGVFDTLQTDFMKPVTEGIEKLLNETDITILKYNGNLDLICSTPGQLLWMDRLQWAGAEAYKTAPRLPIWENDRLEGYSKSYGQLRFFWINVAGHSVSMKRLWNVEEVKENITGQLLWMDRLQWAGAEAYRNAPRVPIWEDDRLEGYSKSYGRLRFFWMNVAGHSVSMIDRLNWAGAEAYRNAPRVPIWEDDRLEGYSKSYGRLRFFWINVAGHSVPRDNPAGSRAFLRDMTGFPLD
ncbi:serine carboxypeptidase domain-containing protein [Phthorimaea operculella]|nr:serine carboxypeptidase domain-containing protein [Phthorimaea operculella]